MATTENTFTGNGTLNNFPFTFPMIKRDDVKVSLNDTLIDKTKYTFTNDTTIVLNAISPATTLQETSGAPKSGVNVRVFRETDVDDPVATFFAGSAIRAQDLNDNFLQVIYRSQEDEDNNWNNNTETIKSNETWDSSDTKIATTAAMDQRFLDEANETIESGETWVSDNNSIATTAAIDARFFNDTTETIQSGESWPNNDTTIATTAKIDDVIDSAIEDDILIDSTGLTKSASGGQVTLGIGASSVDLDRIKAGDITSSGEAWPNNDNTIATTAKIDDMIDAAITGDIATDNTGITVTNDGDGTITLGLANIDLDRIKADDVVTLAEQNAGPTTNDDSIFTTSAASKRFDTIVQTATPSGTDFETGKTWLQNDDDQTLKVWNGSTWLDVASGGSFRSQEKVIYVDKTGGDDSKTGHRISGPKLTIKAAIDDINADIDTSIKTAGTGYANASYTNVPLTGGTTGSGLQANITVSGGGVTACTVTSTATLQEYQIGDILSASASDLGGSGSGFELEVTGGGDGMTVIVAAGIYQEAAPIQIKRRNVSIIGMALRSCIVHPTEATEGDQSAGNHALFELNSGSFIQNLTLTGMKANNSGTNTLDSDLPANQGWNFAFYNGCFLSKSPYIQNCTNFSDSEINNDSAEFRPHRPRGGIAGDIDSEPTGGGMLADGAVPKSTSPLRSMVADSYTHVGLNGPGILVTNNGYAQCTSSYAFFNKYHIKALNGGQANLAASTTDFGDKALVADGKSTSAIFTSTVDGAKDSGQTSFNIDAPTAAASWFGSATRPATNMLVEVNSKIYPILSATANGSGWTVNISRPKSDDRSTNLGLDGAIADGAAVSFYLRSMIASSGHTMEYAGSGTDYRALPENGGVPDETKQITELNNGKIWTAVTDHNGKFKIGGNQTDDPFFEVDQQLGLVTIPEGSIAFNLLSDKTPQLGGNLDVNSKEITSASNGNIVINPNGTGKVGVGDTSPDAKLHVNSGTDNDVAKFESTDATATINLVDNTTTSSISQSGDEFIINADSVDGDDGSRMLLKVDDTEFVRINNNGRVGINQPSDLDHTLCVAGTDNTTSLTGGHNQGIQLQNKSTTNGSYSQIEWRTSGGGRYARIAGIQDDADGDGGQLAFLTETSGGTTQEALRIDSSGQVGVGTTTPTANIETQGNVASTTQFSGFQGLRVQNANGAAEGVTADINLVTGTASNNRGAAIGVELMSGSKNELYFATNGGAVTSTDTLTERMRIDKDGNLLIGTNGSSRNFFGSIPSTLQIEGTGSSATTRGSLSVINNSTGDNPVYIALGKTGANGIGDTTVVGSNEWIGTLSWHGHDGTQFEEAASIRCHVDGTPDTDDMPGRLSFLTNSGGTSVTERMGIDSNGRVKIGNDANYSAAIGSKLAVELMTTAGTILEIADQTAGFSTLESVKNAGGGATDYGGFIFKGRRDADDDTKDYMRIDAAGNVGIGTATASLLGKLHVRAADECNFVVREESNRLVLSAETNSGRDNNRQMDLEGEQIAFVINGGFEKGRFDTSGRLLIGRTSSLNVSGFENHIQVNGTTAEASSISAGRFSNDAGTPFFVFHKSRGTNVSTNTKVQNNDIVGRIAFYGADGTDYEEAANIQAQIDGEPVTSSDGTDMPGRLVFQTTTDGNHNALERMRIDNIGRVVISKEGHAAPTSGTANETLLTIVGNSSNQTNGASLNLWHNDSPGADDDLGTINFLGEADTGVPGAQIKGRSDGTWNDGGDTTDHPGELQFLTTPNTSSVPAVRMTIQSDGKVGIGTTAPSSELQVNGTVAATSFSGDGSNLTNLPSAPYTWSTTSNPGSTSIEFTVPTNARVIWMSWHDWDPGGYTGSELNRLIMQFATGSTPTYKTSGYTLFTGNNGGFNSIVNSNYPGISAYLWLNNGHENGQVIYTRSGANTWTFHGSTNTTDTGNYVTQVSGAFDLGGSPTRVRFTSRSGTISFNNGDFSVGYLTDD